MVGGGDYLNKAHATTVIIEHTAIA